MEQRLLEAEQQQLRIVVPSEISQSNDENDRKTYKDDDDSVDKKDYFVIVCYSSVRIYRERAIKQRKNVST